MKYLVRLCLAVMLLLGSIGVVGKVYAHAGYSTSSPGIDAVLQQAPSEVWVRFTEEVSTRSTMDVWNAAGARVDRGDLRRAGVVAREVDHAAHAAGQQRGGGAAQRGRELAAADLIEIGVIDPDLLPVGHDQLLEGLDVGEAELVGALELEAAGRALLALAVRRGDGLREAGAAALGLAVLQIVGEEFTSNKQVCLEQVNRVCEMCV